MRITKRTVVGWILAGIAALSFSPALAFAQDPNQQQTDNPPPQTPQPDSPPPPAAAPSPLDSQIHPAGQAVPWFGTSSPLRWGDFSIANFSYNFVDDRFQPIGGLPSDDINLNIFRTTLVFDHYFGHGQRILLQYIPQLAILNGKIAGNAGFNNEVALGTTFQVTPRFSLVLKDAFAQVNSRQLYPPNYLAVDQAGGNAIQANFLQNAGSYLRNNVTAIGIYLLSPRDNVTFSSGFTYEHANGNNPQENNALVQSGDDFVESVAYSHQLTARQTIGGLYTLEILHQTGLVDAVGNTLFNTVAGFYAVQLSQTLVIKGQIGGNFTEYPNNAPPLRTVAGGGSIVKSFKNHQGNLALAYTRGRTEDNFIAARIGDLVQLTYSQRLLKHLMWNNGAGYYRETGADPRNFGKTLDSGLAYEIAPSFFVTAQYAYLFQKADDPDLLSGTRNTFIVGFKWEPHALGPQ